MAASQPFASSTWREMRHTTCNTHLYLTRMARGTSEHTRHGVRDDIGHVARLAHRDILSELLCGFWTTTAARAEPAKTCIVTCMFLAPVHWPPRQPLHVCHRSYSDSSMLRPSYSNAGISKSWICGHRIVKKCRRNTAQVSSVIEHTRAEAQPKYLHRARADQSLSPGYEHGRPFINCVCANPEHAHT